MKAQTINFQVRTANVSLYFNSELYNKNPHRKSGYFWIKDKCHVFI